MPGTLVVEETAAESQPDAATAKAFSGTFHWSEKAGALPRRPSPPPGAEKHGDAARSRDNLVLYCDLIFVFYSFSSNINH